MPSALWRLSVSHPRTVFALVLGAVLLALAMFPRVNIDTDPENMLAESQPERVFHNLTKQRFALHELIVVGVVSGHPGGLFEPAVLADLHRLSEAIARIDGVIEIDLMTLSTVDNVTQAGEGMIRFEWLMRRPPADQAGAEALFADVRRLPLLLDTLVSADGRAAALYVPIEAKQQSRRIAAEIEREIAGLGTSVDYHITGLPVAEDTFGHDMFVQMAICAPLAGLVIFLLMWLFFRNVLFVVGPMLVAMGSVIITMGLIIGLGFPIHIMSSMIAIFLMPIAVVDAIHILSDFAERHRPGVDAGELVSEVTATLFRPMLYTSLTSAAGFASLMLTPIPPVQVFGAFVAFGIGLAFVLSMTLLPAFVASLPAGALATMVRSRRPAGIGARLLRGLHALGMQRRGSIIAVSALLLVVGLIGIQRIEVNDNPVRWFKSDHPIRVADRVLNEHLAGTYDAFIVLQGDHAPVRAQLLAALDDGSAIGRELRSELDADQPLAETIAAALDRLDGIEAGADASPQQIESLLAALEDAQQQLAYFQQPELLRWIAGLQAGLDASGHVGKSNALTDLVKTVYRELRGGADSYFVIPPSAAAVAQTLLQFQSSHRPHDLWHFTSTDFSSVAIWLQLPSGDNQDMARVEQWVDAHLQAHPLPAEVRLDWAGKAHLNRVWQQEMVTGMAISLIGAFVAVLLMMILLFRSLLLGLLAMLPLTFTIIVIYGVVGWSGKDYDMPIAVLSALSLGLSVDFAIHFIQRARVIHARTGSHAGTMREMFAEPALAIGRNAVVIAVGFTPLLLAPLMPYVTVGYLLAAIMAVSALASLLLLPALLGLNNGWILRWTGK
jgi:uncharacterized protein